MINLMKKLIRKDKGKKEVNQDEENLREKLQELKAKYPDRFPNRSNRISDSDKRKHLKKFKGKI